MDPYVSQVRAAACAFVGEQSWTVELILQLGAHLAQLVNKASGLSGKAKSEVVCQTILALLEDAEKADTKRVQESTEKGLTTAPAAAWAELKNQVKSVLPTTLSLVVDAARGKFDLKKSSGLALRAVAVLARLRCVGSCVGTSVASQIATAADPQGVTPLKAAETAAEAADQKQQTEEPPKESQTLAPEQPSQPQSENPPAAETTQ